jgi:hypothetical protein
MLCNRQSGVWIPGCASDVYLHNTQTGTEAVPASYSMDTGIGSRGHKSRGMKSTTNKQLLTRLTNTGLHFNVFCMARQTDGRDEAKMPFAVVQMHLKRFQAKVIDKKKLCSITYSRKSCLLWDMWKKVVQLDRPQITKWCKHITCWIFKAKNT